MILIDKAKLVDKAFKKVKEFASDNYHDGYDYALALVETMDKAEEVDAIPIEWLENFRDGLDLLSESRLMDAIDLIIDAYRVEKKRTEELDA